MANIIQKKNVHVHIKEITNIFFTNSDNKTFKHYV